VIATNSQIYSGSTSSLIDGGVATLAAFAPAPEPTSLALFATSFLGLGGVSAWRRRKGMNAQA
jgi:hypothetical protein